MMHVVQMGVTGWIGHFSTPDSRLRPAGCRVICRTKRGLEAGTVMAAFGDQVTSSDGLAAGSPCDGELLRRVTPDDEKILERIERHREKAFAACCALLKERSIPAVLVDAEHLFDGQNLYFYFLGEPPPELEEMTQELAETWEAKVRFRAFTQRLAEGCGPDCGAGGKSCGTSCGSCSIKGHCGSR